MTIKREQRLATEVVLSSQTKFTIPLLNPAFP